ncbi:hypothetical protein GCM10010924_52480 [Rhizobium wenxiniae]|uniref:Uncharacterized protein n=1 Tax=Rhizobium wenxiniae TaxID=1737357 RepID=A0A7W9YBT9_9HYPH|nr:hypothetical protein [Rhizobium wenxiniae]MBB6165650.1 hypothetical protein [Rhizobium wenxiniae]GGG16938.1 hypothetical protein GCM10010924_52480 [Rhizobium wenxiniae]
MAALSTALKIAKFMIRAVWFLILLAYLAVVAPFFLMPACFITFWGVLAFSYAFLPPEWTLALWQSASDLYAHSPLFKAATIMSFTLLCLPILAGWPGSPPVKSQRELDEEVQMSVMLSRQQNERRAKVSGPLGDLHEPAPSYWDF